MKQNPNALIHSIIYFQNSLTNPLPPSFETHIISLKEGLNHQPLRLKIISIITQRYYQIVNNSICIQEFLLIKFLQILNQFLEKIFSQEFKSTNNKKQIKQISVILLSTSISHLKSAPHKSISNPILRLISMLLNYLTKHSIIQITAIYPKIYSFLMTKAINALNSIQNRQVGHHGLQLYLQIISTLILHNKSLCVRTQNKLDPNSLDQFSKQSSQRLNNDLKSLVNCIGNLNFQYIQTLKQFIIKISTIKTQNITLKGSLALIMTCLNIRYLQYLQCDQLQMSYINQLLANQYMKVLSNSYKFQDKSANLKILCSLGSIAQINNEQQLEIIMKGYRLQLYAIGKTPKLSVLNLFSEPLGILPLDPTDSFKSQNLSSLYDAYIRQEQLRLSQCLYSASGDLIIVKLLIEHLASLNISFKKRIIQFLYDQMLLNQYTIDMSLSKFYKFLTDVLVIKMCISGISNNQLPYSLYKKIFILFTSSQYLRLLQPSYKQEQILISLSLFIILSCYLALLKDNSSKLQLIRYKITIYQIILNNLSQNSYAIRLSTQYALLTIAAPLSIRESISTVQSTLIHRNLNNVNLITNLIKYGNLNKNQSNELAEVYYSNNSYNRQTADIIRILIPILQPQITRKCILSSRYWPLILKGNTAFLNQRQIGKGQKIDNFFGNDGDNVSINNVLGVLILQLRDKWKFQLESPRKQTTVDLILQLVSINPNLIFFRSFFDKNIIPSLITIINTSQKYSNIARISNKVLKILQKIPLTVYDIYQEQNLRFLVSVTQNLYNFIRKQIMLNYNSQKSDNILETLKLLENINDKINKVLNKQL